MSERSRVTISTKGDDAMTGAVRAAAATINLLETLAEEIAPGSDLKWSVGEIGWRCDRCEKQVGAERPDSWTRDGSDDLCEACSA